jgi:hypothetical protein
MTIQKKGGAPVRALLAQRGVGGVRLNHSVIYQSASGIESAQSAVRAYAAIYSKSDALILSADESLKSLTFSRIAVAICAE